jgi:hypothetical protein
MCQTKEAGPSARPFAFRAPAFSRAARGCVPREQRGNRPPHLPPSGGTISAHARSCAEASWKDTDMNNIIYIVGLVVVVLAVLTFFGLR